MTIEKIIKQFKLKGKLITAKPFGNGHINDTYLLVYNQSGTEKKYILRKINKYVFKKPETVIQNSLKITDHIKNHLKNSGIKDTSRRVVQFVKTFDDKPFFTDENHDYWCVILFIENAYTVDYVRKPNQAYEAAKAFGLFQKLISDAPVNEYQYTIPDFHNLQKRLNLFDSVLADDMYSRKESAKPEIELAKKYRFLETRIESLLERDELPLRIVHNDTKINNVMLDNETDEGICVIDLDTVMPGYIISDFGDMVRTFTSPVAEDEQDISKVTMRMEIFEALVNGYLFQLKEILTQAEIDNLVYGAQLITYEQSIRFLTDYLNGDVYYSTAYSDHNLIRARNQFALLESIMGKSDSMKNTIKFFL